MNLNPADLKKVDFNLKFKKWMKKKKKVKIKFVNEFLYKTLS